jgi:hypothetical protein
MQINLSDCRVKFWKEMEDGCTPSAVSYILAFSCTMGGEANLEVLRELLISLDMESEQ